MAKPLTSWLVPSFSPHNVRLVVSEFRDVVQDKFTRLRASKQPQQLRKVSNMLYRHVFDKISTEFRGILLVFVNFAALRRREIPEALTTSCIIYTNLRPKIYIWRLHFSSWSPKGDLRIFLISSPGMSSSVCQFYFSAVIDKAVYLLRSNTVVIFNTTTVKTRV